MIATSSDLRLRRVALSRLRVCEVGAPWTCYPERCALYVELLTTYPEQEVEPLVVLESSEVPGMYDIKNGKHRFCAALMAGRLDVWCLVECPLHPLDA